MKRTFLFFALIGIMIMNSTLGQTIRYVSSTGNPANDGSSWINASSNLQAMINASSAGDQVWIAGGTYLLSALLEMKQGVNVFGGFYGNETDIISRPKSDLDGNGTIEAWEFTYASVLNRSLRQASNFSVETIWDGVTIAGVQVTYGDGAGAYIRTNGKLINSIVRDNATSGGSDPKGGGVYNNGGVISFCLISGNKTTPSGYAGGSGSGIYCTNSTDCFVSDCIIENNIGEYFDQLIGYGGGIYQGNVKRCIIRGNKSSRGGGLYRSFASDCLVLNNIANTSGGGAYEGTVLNCTFVGNSAGSPSSGGGGVYGQSSSSFTITNCVFWKNNVTQIYPTTSLNVTYSAVQGGFAGTGNITILEDNENGGPMFINPTVGNYQLQIGSPCIDVGTISGVINPSTAIDLNRNPRIVNGIVDMGAYEWQILFVPVTDITLSFTTATATEPFELIGIVIPSNATNQTITWSVQNAGTTGATIAPGSNILNTTASGTAIVQATVVNGVSPTSDFTKPFTITVNKATQTAPAAPTMQSRTPTSITLHTVSGCEYNINGGTYQTSPTFTGLTPSTSYTFTQRKAETATYLASPASPPATFTTDASNPPVLGGTVTITGNTVFGQTLTANTSGLTCTPSGPLGTLSYQWKRGTTNIGTNSSTYTLVQADIGNKITVTVTAANCTGSVTSAATATVTKATQTVPAAPTLASASTTSITLVAVNGYEYNINGGTYQSSSAFNNLTPNTSYAFTQRYAETDTHFASPASVTAIFTTDDEVGIDESKFENINIYPNPTTGMLTIENGELRIENVEIFDIYGRKLYLSTRPLIHSSTVNVDISHLSAGVYFLKINTETGQVIKKVLKE